MSLMIPKRTINLREKVKNHKWQKRYYSVKQNGAYGVYYDQVEDCYLFCLNLTVMIQLDHFETMDNTFPSHRPGVKLTQEQWRDPGPGGAHSALASDYLDRGYSIKVLGKDGKVRMSM